VCRSNIKNNICIKENNLFFTSNKTEHVDWVEKNDDAFGIHSLLIEKVENKNFTIAPGRYTPPGRSYGTERGRESWENTRILTFAPSSVRNFFSFYC